jgi:hypothetical protein
MNTHQCEKLRWKDHKLYAPTINQVPEKADSGFGTQKNKWTSGDQGFNLSINDLTGGGVQMIKQDKVR